MAKKRKNLSAAFWFGPALAAPLICLVIAGSAVGYVWQKGEIDRLGRLTHQREARLKQLTDTHQRLAEQILMLQSPALLDQRVRELNLGLVPLQPGQVVRLTEPAGPPALDKPDSGPLAARSYAPMTP
jgi:transposase